MRLREWKSALVAVCVATSAAAQVTVRQDGAQDLTEDGRVLVEIGTSRDTYFVGEPISLRLRVSIEREFLRTNLVQMFRQRLDIPAQLVVPWIDDLPGAIAIAPAPTESGHSLALNEDVTGATLRDDRESDGRKFAVVEIERRYLGARPGELRVPAPIVRFAYATHFEDDFVSGPVARNRTEAFVRGEPLVLTIAPLPEDGRPREFTGAVGRFSCWGEARPAVVEVGESVKLVLRIEGEGNLASFDPPRLDDFAGFDLHGVIDDQGAARRTITYDLAPRSADITQVPPIPFAFFDPGSPAQYRLVFTSPISIVVQPSSRGTNAKGDATPPSARETEPSARRSFVWSAVLAVLGLLGAGIFIRVRARRRPA
jgi:hypothetical protein